MTLRLGLIACVAGALLLEGDAGGQDKKNPKKKNEKNENYAQHLKRLEAKFTAWDTNKDGSLDKDELARAFRGAGAKAFDRQPAPKSVEPTPPVPVESTETFPVRAAPKVASVAVASFPQPGCPVNLAVAEMMTWRKPAKIRSPTTVKKPPPPAKVDYSTYPDFQFLSLVKGADDRISHKEFDAWARSYAKSIDDYEDAQRELKVAQAKLTQAKAKAKAPAIKQAQAEVQRHQQELSQANRDLALIPLSIHKAFNIRP